MLECCGMLCDDGKKKRLCNMSSNSTSYNPFPLRTVCSLPPGINRRHTHPKIGFSRTELRDKQINLSTIITVYYTNTLLYDY